MGTTGKKTLIPKWFYCKTKLFFILTHHQALIKDVTKAAWNNGFIARET